MRLLQEREAEVRQLAASLDEEAGAREGEHLRMQRSLHDLERQLRASQVPTSTLQCCCYPPRLSHARLLMGHQSHIHTNQCQWWVYTFS